RSTNCCICIGIWQERIHISVRHLETNCPLKCPEQLHHIDNGTVSARGALSRRHSQIRSEVCKPNDATEASSTPAPPEASGPSNRTVLQQQTSPEAPPREIHGGTVSRVQQRI